MKLQSKSLDNPMYVDWKSLSPTYIYSNHLGLIINNQIMNELIVQSIGA